MPSSSLVEVEVGVEVEVITTFSGWVVGWLEKWRIEQSSNLKLNLELGNFHLGLNLTSLKNYLYVMKPSTSLKMARPESFEVQYSLLSTLLAEEDLPPTTKN